ncbi:snRNA-activating protein complex subunit 4 isoform X2 [Melanotaenia boesemani]|uniref:snRNA-activating protein complex subunit 4 isoform X2 n=1 Tax=Melanotaenia boesemani TaxID=1250792 RepID=UPI001C04D17F|nr:snRNA-activating protein complex subunit 4 isoform X2 [Melanotaenia boesemani]
MSASLSAERDRIQRQVEELEQSLAVTQNELDLLSSETDDGSHDEDVEDESAAGLMVQREKVQREIQDLEDILGAHSPITVSDDDAGSSSDESDLGLSLSVDSCLQLNLVYQQVVQETLNQLETLLSQNRRQQEELVAQMSGPTRESSSEPSAHSSYQHPMKLFLGRFLKPYFKDKLTGLGPPANQEAKQRNMRMTGYLDDKKLKMKRWTSWQKNLLIHSVARDSLKRLVQPKLSRVDFLTQKMSSADEADREQLREQIDGLEKEIDLLREKKEEELIGDRFEEHDWQKISNIDFEGTKDPEDIRAFWQNFLHPSVNKTSWSKEEVQQLKEISRKHQERHWERIAEELGMGRTAFMCLQVFQRFVSDSLKRGSWTPNEDVLLRELVDKMRIGNFIPYTQMSYFMEGRDPAQLIYRWNQVLDPSLKKGLWSKEEDEMLLQAVARHGEKNWWKVRLEVPGRTDGSCRDRYLDCLRSDVKRGSFDKQEIKLLKELVEKHGVGRWSKIASEIPHRLDSQCMREWKKLNRPPSKRCKAGNTSRRRKRGDGKKKAAKQNIRKLLGKIKVEKEEVVDEMTEEEEEEDMVIPYMESDDEKKPENLVGELAKVMEVAEQEEQEYVVPPMKEWLPVDKVQSSTSLTFHLVMLPPSSDAQDGDLVRLTILGKSGRSVIIGPRPRELPCEERNSSGAMMMVSADQLRKHLTCRVQKFKNPNHGEKTSSNKGTEKSTEYELQAAVLPWIGHLLIPKSSTRTASDALREEGEKRGASSTSTSLFLLFLQTMNVDIIGCKEMIEQRKNKVVVLTPPTNPLTVKMKNSRTVAGVLQQRRKMRQRQDWEDDQRRLMLRQLQTVEEEKLRQLMQPRTLPNLLHLVPQEPPHPTGSIHVIRAPHIGAQAAPLAPPPVSVVSMLQATPLAPPPFCYPAVPAVPSTSRTLSPPRGGGQREGEEEHACRSSSVGGSGVPSGRGAPLETEPEAMKTASSSSSTDTDQTQTSVLLPPVLPLPVSSQFSTSFCSDWPVSPAHSLSLAQPPPTASPLHLKEHSYSFSSPDSSQPSSASKCLVPDHMRAPKQQSRTRKRQREEKQQEEQSVDGAGTGRGVTQEGKRPRKPSLKGIALQESKAEAKKKRRSSSSPLRKRSRKCSPSIAMAPPPPQIPPAGLSLLPGQSMWVMTHSGLVQLAQAPAQGMKVVFVPPTGGVLNPSMAPSPLRPNLIVPANRPFLASPMSHCKPHPSSIPLPHNSSHLHQPPPKVNLPYKGTVKADSEKAPSLRYERLQFDPSLMFLEPREVVCNWLSGLGGVVVPGARTALPYLPPFISTLSTLSLLLQAKKSLTQASLQLLSKEMHPPPSKPCSTQPPPDLPDSTSDLNPAEEEPGNPPISTEEEEEQVKAVRQLVAERFSTNPAYQLLKARFLSLFTVPALLATVQPVTKKQQPCLTNQEEDGEESDDEEELKKIEERGRQRKTERSLLLSGSTTAPASHFSGICTQTADQTGHPKTGPH